MSRSRAQWRRPDSGCEQGVSTMWELPIEGGIPWLVWILDLLVNGS
ncbi:hypothetical protein ACH47B_00530 [Rhodococcus sp. NPDC019627]|nr:MULTISPECIES: hypothetical protein [unclassified Rhodococcus (in: high G+C Gram-positive bacteria)]MDV7351762.1 hypothetical protein [Rhodococcus oxybenzonivorans]QHE69646.1 hypothetical protein GFS60_03216 [Rhodococcus sp. WAY2]